MLYLRALPIMLITETKLYINSMQYSCFFCRIYSTSGTYEQQIIRVCVYEAVLLNVL